MKVGILIPSTSKGRSWNNYKESYLFKHTFITFLKTYDKEHNYKFYIGIDKNDIIYDNEDIKNEMRRFMSVMKNVELDFYYMTDITKGHLTVMWNKLFDIALEENNDYFIQCGDDIEFHTKGWINTAIDLLKNNDNIGVAGPINNNPRILTQSIVSRKHKELFGYYFPPEIINWFCDDWINEIYKKINAFFPMKEHYCNNIGGQPRYTINNDNTFTMNFKQNMSTTRNNCMEIVKKDYEKIKHLLPIT